MPETIDTPADPWTVQRKQVTWLQTHLSPPRVTHPWQWELAEPDGYLRYFDTRAEAVAFAHDRYTGAGGGGVTLSRARA